MLECIDAADDPAGQCSQRYLLTGMISAWTRSAGMGRQIIAGWDIILAMALALTCTRDCMAGRSPQAARRSHLHHRKMLQTPALPPHEPLQALVILDEELASAAGTVSTFEGDFLAFTCSAMHMQRLLRVKSGRPARFVRTTPSLQHDTPPLCANRGEPRDS